MVGWIPLTTHIFTLLLQIHHDLTSGEHELAGKGLLEHDSVYQITQKELVLVQDARVFDNVIEDLLLNALVGKFMRVGAEDLLDHADVRISIEAVREELQGVDQA